jgi:hypothetical protein
MSLLMIQLTIERRGRLRADDFLPPTSAKSCGSRRWDLDLRDRAISWRGMTSNWGFFVAA